MVPQYEVGRQTELEAHDPPSGTGLFSFGLRGCWFQILTCHTDQGGGVAVVGDAVLVEKAGITNVSSGAPVGNA